MSIVILCGIYLAELACYQLGIRILFEARQKTKLWMMIGILFPVVIGCLPVDVSGKNVLVTASVIVVMFLSLDGMVSENGIKLILILLLLECIDDSLSYPSGFLLSVIDNKYVGSLKYLVSQCFMVLALLMINLIRIKLDQKKKEHIKSEIYFIIGVIAASMMFCLTVLNHVKEFLKINRYIILCNILNVVINVSIILLVIFVIYIKNTHERMEQLLKTEKILKESQVSYYKLALKKESDTRRYRHDMVNHLGYIRDILDENRIGDAKKYLSSILGRFNKILNIYRVTGNDMVDTIMNHLFSVLPEDAEILIKNKSPIEFDMEDTDVCTIFSNLFQNAVDEILENNIKAAKVIIVIHKGKKYVEYNIKNTLANKISSKSIDKNGFPKSYKRDWRNHGIGLINVKEAIEKNGGNFEWSQDDEYFNVKVILPLKQ